MQTEKYSSIYETTELLNQYLLFHYGEEKDLLPYAFGPQLSLNFPVRCVTECLDRMPLQAQSTALEIGCAVGRSSFELSRFFSRVVAIDNSSLFIDAARYLQKNGSLEFSIIEEGIQKDARLALVPPGTYPEHVDFQCRDVMSIADSTEKFDVVLAANVLCRLSNPKAFLRLLPHLVKANGQLILTSPYSWLDQFTPAEYWITDSGNCRKSPIELIKEVLHEYFILKDTFDLPFLLREHRRKYQWGVSQASLWSRR